MKKLIIIIAAITVTALSPSYSQGFLNKINKGLDKINKGLDDLNKELDKKAKKGGVGEAANLTDNEAYKSVLIKSFSSQVEITLESCIRDGNKVIITYYLTNKGKDFTISNLGTKKTIMNPDDETLIVGDNGRNYTLKYYELGNVNTNTLSRLNLPSSVRLKGKFEIDGVSPNVKQFSLINIAGLVLVKQNPDDFKPFSFSFRNVPVYSFDESLAMMNPKELLTIDEPSVSKITLENTGIRSVTITDKYTRVDCYWTNTQFNPQGSIFLTDAESSWIEMEGNKYMLLQYAGIGARKDDVWVKYNQTINFTCVFEPIPANSTSFDMHSGDEDINFIGVNLREDESSRINIPETTGLFTSLDIRYDAFYKRTRMTATDRKKYQIDKVKHEFISSTIPNNQLAKGKLIYQGNEGRIETFLYIIQDNVTYEFLVSYDKAGNYLDCICLGSLSAYGGDTGYAEISGNKIITHSYYPPEEGEEELEYLVEYKVKPNLHFSKLKESTRKPKF